MTDSEKRAYRSTLAIFALVLGLAFIVGVVGDKIGHSRGDFEKAESILEDLRTLAAEVPRLENGAILRQGMFSTGWLDDVGALPARLQAMPDSLRGAEGQHSLGLVKSGPWTSILILEARDSLIWATLTSLSRPVCETIVRAAAKHPEEIAYLTAAGDPPAAPSASNPASVCRNGFNDLALIVLDASTEFRRLTDDIHNAVEKASMNSTDKLFLSGSSAPFQVDKSKEGSVGYLKRGASGLRVTVGNVPLSVCRLALLVGPQAFGMDAAESAGGETVNLPQTRVQSDAFCNRSAGQLTMSRR